ncbi:carboxypeptidase-like regulatory domain-containing protein [Halosquirtibacter laminarini]|uniref:Carboxypeptidase-like regulatory domain-containing protein n=1 Tax=Halosquirtibacter laminarini TaxID=3374600 RepID=A0AC61NGM5_9BACT|nr:carboxypeptidase-like regulatory domain-containing protein [Prolixibacteraceae bacterium]
MKSLYTILICTLFSLQTSFNEAKAENYIIQGKVVESKTNQPIPDVMVTIRTSDNKIIRFTKTSSNGNYTLKTPYFLEKHYVNFAMMGFAPKSVLLTKEQHHYNIKMEEKATEIKEVIVNAKGINEKGDTLSYIVSKFSDIQDKSLADVLKKMPGIEVSKTGEIKYNGTPINRFYIEGRDLMGSKYGLATNNVHPEDVGSVEVYERHQPIKAMEDLSVSQNPAINIRLKADAKKRWVGTVKAGTGYKPFLWNGEGLAMKFSKKAQNFHLCKSNNTGDDITRETRDFKFKDLLNPFSNSYKLHSYIDVHPDYISNIDADYTRFNRSNLVSLNNLWGIGDDFELSTKINYTNNRLESDVYTKITDYLPDGNIVREIIEEATDKNNHILGDVVLSCNTKTLFLENTFKSDFSWSDLNMTNNGSYPNNQIANIPTGLLSNKLKLVKRKEKHAYTLNAYVSYQNKKENLNVVNDETDQEQEVNATAYFANVNSAISFYKDALSFRLRLGASALSRSLESSLDGIDKDKIPTSNDLTMKYLRLYAGPELEYKRRTIEAKLTFPLSFVPYRYDDMIKNEQTDFSMLLLSSSLYIRVPLSARLSTSLSGKISQTPIDEQRFYSGMIMQDFWNLSVGHQNREAGMSKNITLGLKYKNALDALFSDISITKSWNDIHQTRDRYFYDQYQINTFIDQESESESWIAMWNIAKGISALKGKISMSSLYWKNDNVIYQNNEASPYQSTLYSISPKINIHPTKWSSITYKVDYSNQKVTSPLDSKGITIQDWKQIMTLGFIPNDKFVMKLKGTYIDNQQEDLHNDLAMASAEMTYFISKRCEITLEANNLFNQETYTYSLQNGYTNIYKSYKLRPRSYMVNVFFRF